jgi:hypothetical protein
VLDTRRSLSYACPKTFLIFYSEASVTPMVILLINPPHPSIGSRIPHEHLPPLGLLAVGGPLIDAGHDVRLLDAEFGPLPAGQIVEQVVACAPEAILVGHSGSTSGHPIVADITRAIRAALPETWIVYGGVFPTYHWREVLAEESQIDVIVRGQGEGTWMEQVWAPMAYWISFVHRGLTEASQGYPFILYGTDWLAFAHIVLAIAFLGPLRDPVKNLWVIEFGMIACLLVLPVAMIFGPIRGIPLFWRLLDCSFGVIGIIPLWLSRRYVQRLVALEASRTTAGI